MKLLTPKLALSIGIALILSACSTHNNSSTTIKRTQALVPQTETTQETLTQQETQNGNLTTYTLNNGLKVILKQDHRSPVVMTQIWYNVGSSDEKIHKGGISHFVEHLMFKDTPLLSGDDYHRVVSHFGGRKNAFTSDDFTAYYEGLPANQYPLALQIESNRMVNVIFDPAQIATEKKVIQEERRQRTDDNPIAKAYEEFAPIAMPDTPKSRPIIGSMDDIENLSPDDLKAWYDTWYAPNNATLVLVGDFDVATAKSWIERYFKDLQPKTLPARQNLSQKTHQGYKTHTSYQAVQVPMLVLGFNVPSIHTNKSDAYALSLLSDIADGGLSARFEKNLIRGAKLFDNISINYDLIQKGDGLFTVLGTPKQGVDFKTAEQAILDELTKFANEDINDDEILRSQNTMLSSLIFENDSIDNQAQNLGMLSTLGLPLDTLETMPQVLKTVKKDDIKAVAKKYLIKDNLSTMTILPLDKKPSTK